MRTEFPRSLVLFGIATLALTACGQNDQNVTTATAPILSLDLPAAPPADPVPVPTTAEIQARMEAYTYEQLAEFVTLMDELDRQADAERAELNTGYNEMLAPPALQEAMAELRAAAADFKADIDSFDNVESVTWSTVRSNLATSWVVLQGALAKARSEKN